MRLYITLFSVFLFGSCAETVISSRPAEGVPLERGPSPWCIDLHKLIKDQEYKKAIIHVKKHDQENINCRDEFGDIPILRVNRSRFVGFVNGKIIGTELTDADVLLRSIMNHPKFDPNAQSRRGANSLFRRDWSIDELDELVKKGADINQITTFGETPLNALRFDKKDQLEKFIFYVGHKDYKKNQASLDRILHESGDVDIIDYAIKNGALVTFGQDNQSPLFSLLGDSPEKKARLILEQAKKQGFDLREFINHKRRITSGLNPIYDGDTALHEVVRLYVESKAVTPLFFASQSSKWEKVIKLMLGYGADPKIKNKADESPEDVAIKAGYNLP